MRRRLRAGAGGDSAGARTWPGKLVPATAGGGSTPTPGTGDTPTPEAWTIAPPPVRVPVAPPPAGPVVAGAPSTVLVVRGLLLGLAAAGLAAWAWAGVVALTSLQIGYAAIAIGLLVGGAVRVGSGRVTGHVPAIGSVVLTLLSMATAEFLIVRHFTQETLAAEGWAGTLPLWLGFDVTVEVVVDSITADPLTLVFWILALLAAWRLATRPQD